VSEEQVITLTPQKYEYTFEDFMSTEPYDRLYDFFGSPFVFQAEVEKVAKRAKEVKFPGFKKMLKTYLEAQQIDRRKNMVPNQTEFEGQYIELNCGIWNSTDFGIYRDTAIGGKDVACAHPIMPVERLVNIDTNEVKLKLAFKRAGTDRKWQTTIVGKDVISTARSITSLSSQGISVTSTSASTLVDYLNDMENLNYDIIPERKSIGRLGYVEGEGFSPYVEDLVFDGDASFRNLYGCVSSKGSLFNWIDIAKECRAQSTTAKIMLAASFASPLLSIVGSLPFFVHLWGVDSGTGKTVALMLAASVWGNPAVGSYVQTFNGTQVGQERTAAFLNHLPMCLDELQLTKNSKGQSNFDVYQLAQGVGRSRGKKQGGVEAAPTWNCCFLTTGESPLTTAYSGAGAVNRVIDIECTSGTVAIKDGHRVSGVLKSNYGQAGEIFVQKLYQSEDTLRQIRETYQDFFKTLCDGDSTEKQAMAAAAILTADLLASMWIFQDDTCLTVQEISEFLASREAVSAGHRAYDWLCDWVAENENRFYHHEYVPGNDIYGMIENNIAYINPKVFRDSLLNAGFNSSATLSYLRSNKLIVTSKPDEYTKAKRIGSTSKRYIWLKLVSEYDECDEEYL
jgi:uncharacterized protein (DUF927 family)